MSKFFGVLSLILFLSGCKSSQAPIAPIQITGQADINYAIVDEELQLRFKNYLKAPLRFHVSVSNEEINSKLKALQPVLLNAETDTLIKIPVKGHPNLQPVFKVFPGDLKKPVVNPPVALPVRRYKPVRILQGHNGSYSHNEDRNRYAIDFKLKIGDTVYSASDGVVVQMIEDYKYGGKDKRWLNMANKIMVYEPGSGRFFSYSHLVHRGSFVKKGDPVKQGQPIGLAGNTGFSDTPHLHFNVSIPDTSTAGLLSVPVDFIEGFKGADLKKKVILEQEKLNSSVIR